MSRNSTQQPGQEKAKAAQGSSERGGVSFEALDESLAQLEAKLSSLQNKRPPAGAPAERARAAVAAPALSMPPEPARSAAPWKDATAPIPSDDRGVVREIDRVRTEVSDELGRRFEELNREVASLRASVASDRTVNVMEAEFGRVYDGLEAVATALDKQGNAREVKHELDELRRSVKDLASEETLHAVGRGQDELARRLSKHHASIDPEIATIRGQLDELMKRAADGADSQTLIAIERRLTALSKTIDEVRTVTGEGPDLRAIEARLEDVARAVVAAAQVTPELDTAPFERIEARIASHQRRLDEREKTRAAENELAAKHADARFDQVLRGQDTALATTGQIAEGLTARFDDLATAVGEERVRSSAEVRADIAPRFDQIAKRIDGVGGRIEDHDLKLDSWGQRLEAEIARPREPEINMFKALAARLDAVSDRLAELPDAGTDDQNWAALEARMATVMHKIDQLPTDGVDPGALDALRAQLGSIAWRLEQPEDNAAMQGQLDALTESVKAVQDKPDLGDETIGRLTSSLTESLEDRLVERFDNQLSSRLNELTDVLHSTTAPLAEIGPRMDALEDSMADAQITLVETARTAAEEVVKSMLEQQAAMEPAEAEAVAALDEDLKRLETLTVNNDARNNKTFDAVHETLLKIVDRLDQLDTMVAKQGEGADQAVVAAAAQAVAAQNAASMASASAPVSSEGGSLMERLRGRAAEQAAVPAAETDAAPAPLAEFNPDLPLQPGTHAPRFDPPGIDGGTGEPTMDVDQIVSRVRAGDDEVDPAADFMATARRKAKSVAEEAEFTGTLGGDGGKAKGRKSKGKGKDAKIKASEGANDNASKIRRPLLIAAAAATIAVVLGLVGMNSTLTPIGDRSATNLTPTSDTSDPFAQEAVSLDPIVADVVDDVEIEAPVDEPFTPIETADAFIDEAPELPEDPGTDAIETQAVDVVEEFNEVQQSVAEAGAAAPFAIEKEAAVEVVTGPVTDISLTADDGPAALVAAAKAGDARALFEIAGRASGRDPVRAFALYAASAQRGLAPAQYRLGQAYEKGRGTEVDLVEASEWYRRAAEAGNTSAMHNLAVLHAMGDNGGGDAEKAGEWFTKAAEYGVKDSQYNLGILHAQGNGVAEDLTESYKWFDAAAKAGDPEAGGKREEVAQAMSPAQREEARAKVAEWRAKSPPLAANRVVVPDAWRAAPTMAAEDMKKAVRNVQAILNKNGFDAGSPDGVMGRKTRQAIMKFQTSVGQKATGEIDDALVKELLKRNS